ncbi:MAG TPA: FAD-linked oxidase C-terminal domain-containing protein, partial [Thermopolyspora sp.]
MDLVLRRALRERVDGEIRFDPGSRATYATDASNYRQVPVGVVVPRTVEAAAEAVMVCREHDVPIVSRGGGTSLAGQSCNAAVVIDWSKYCTSVVSVNAENRTAVVEPGIVLDALNARVREQGLIYGPKPATHSHCTLGGMIGNNSCGATAQAFGKTVDNIHRLEVLTYDGTRFWAGPTTDADYERIIAAGGRRAEIYRALRDLRDRYGALIRARFPRIPRRVSGYNLDALLPENGFDVARALVGSESTLVTILRAELKLAVDPPARALLVLGYPSIFAAADAVPTINAHQPFALEALDERLITFEKTKHLNPEALKLLPEGAGWLMVQFDADTAEAADAKARRLIDDLDGGPHTPSVHFLDDPAREDEMWRVREAGLGATAQVPGKPDTWPGWEDSAVAPERLGGYLRELHRLMREYGYAETASLYGHFGHGCVHTRIPFDLVTAPGVRRFREFVERSADLVARYDGSLSGEHGDGQARAELWPVMFGHELMPAFAEFKQIFDPTDRMNPGKLLGPGYEPAEPVTHFGYPSDSGSFARAALRCVGVGDCRRDEGGVMCPSYRVTREEEHSTRGRARLLFEMLNGEVVERHSPEVHDALDLCLACKGCKSDCPVNVDMATYKAEFMAGYYRGRPRPMSHYSMGWLPVLARAAALAPGVVNTLLKIPGARRLGGLTPERPAPAFAPARFSSAFARHAPPGAAGDGGRQVMLWPDTFTDNFHPAIGMAALRVLRAAGFTVRLPEAAACCGLTWISTGQLGMARRTIERTVRVLRPAIRQGLPIVVLEPSCAAVFRSDAHELMPNDPDVRRLRELTVTLAELLERDGWQPPRLDRTVIAQPHCHQHAILKYDADAELLRRAGADLTVLDAGCCGLAGNFGFEPGHFAVSMACAEEGLLPAVRGAAPDTLILADGFSC